MLFILKDRKWTHYEGISFKNHGGSQNVRIVQDWLRSLAFRFCRLSVFHLSLLSFRSFAVLLYRDIYLLGGSRLAAK